MEVKRLGQLGVWWLKGHLKSILLYIVLMLIYCSVTILSRIPLEPVLYSTYVFCFIGIAVSVWDYSKYVKRYHSLVTTYLNRSISLEALPQPRDLIESNYQELVYALYQDRQGMGLALEQQRTEMTNYYTLWAHQIKTPIAAMKLLLHQKEELSGYILEMELFKIEQYVEMVLQYLRLESISSDLVLKPYDLYNMVKQVIKKYAINFIERKLSVAIEPFEQTVLTDEKWASLIIEQVISNSLKYTHEGGITITTKDTEKETQLIVTDTGIGISPEDLPRIFERGFTGYNGRMDKKSTGIGLYLCKEVANKLSHTLEVTSNVGEGTTVILGFRKHKAL